MTTSMEDLKATMDTMSKQLAGIQDMARQFPGLQDMVTTALDRIQEVEAWHTIVETSMGSMMQQSQATTTRLQQLETRPLPPLPAPPPAPQTSTRVPQQPSLGAGMSIAAAPPRGPIDLDVVPQPAAVYYTLPNGRGLPHDHRDVGGGILGSPPPLPVTVILLVCGVIIARCTSRSTRSRQLSRLASLPSTFRALQRLGCRQFSVEGEFSRGSSYVHWSLRGLTRINTPKQLKQLESLKQSGSVEDYLTQFEKLAHGILLYNDAYDDVYFVTRFVAGLKPEIRAAISLYRPADVATASALAILHEEEIASARGKSLDRGFSKSSARSGLTDYKKTAESDKAKLGIMQTESSDKFQELKQFRRKNGLCFKCGNKWGHNHQCPDQVSLHVVEELLDAIGSYSEEMNSEEDDSEVEETVLALHSSTPASNTKRKTFKLLATIGNQQVLVLVDSGSIGTFISEQLVQKLKLQTSDCPHLQYKAADGGILNCSTWIPSLQWHTQGTTFSSSPQVLSLKCFDFILGEDWLEEVSPIWVDYKQKLMKVTYKGKRVSLQGVQETNSTASAISSQKLQGLLKHNMISHCVAVQLCDQQEQAELGICTLQLVKDIDCPMEIRTVLQAYEHLFETPKTLPPHRMADHSIPLIAGAQPITARPYKYSPVQKDEIDRQLKEMLDTGIIRPSSSSFASLVLLVKKKDLSWRFCIDYRQLC